MNFTELYLAEATKIIADLDVRAIEAVISGLAAIRSRGGRLFVLGVGGSAANASHAVNDFRKICDFEAYTPVDNVAELTARTNDDGWASTFVEWLRCSRLNSDDGLLVLSVGGGNSEKNVSLNLIKAVQFAKQQGATVVAVLGREDGFTAAEADACVIVPIVNTDHVTPHSEAFQAVIWHLFVSHPKLRVNRTKWESVS